MYSYTWSWLTVAELSKSPYRYLVCVIGLKCKIHHMTNQVLDLSKCIIAPIQCGISPGINEYIHWTSIVQVLFGRGRGSGLSHSLPLDLQPCKCGIYRPSPLFLRLCTFVSFIIQCWFRFIKNWHLSNIFYVW